VTIEEILERTWATKQLCLAMIAGGDSPERAAERLGINPKLVELIISIDMIRRRNG